MGPQLLKVTNAYNSETVYINRDKIIMITVPNKVVPRTGWSHAPRAVIYYGAGDEDHIMVAETVDKLLERFPPV